MSLNNHIPLRMPYACKHAPMPVKTECDSLTFIWHCENAFDIQPVLRGKQNEFDSCQSRNEFDLEETNLIIDAGYRNLGWLTTTHLKYYPLKSCSNMGRDVQHLAVHLCER